MLQLEAYSGNMCVELFHVMNVGVDRATLSLHHEALFLIHTVYARSEVFSRSSRYSEAQPEQADAKHRSR